MNTINIRKLRKKESLPYDLLYLADESVEAVAEYIPRSNCYVATIHGQVVGEYVLLPTRPFTVELVNVAVAESQQGKGIGKQLVLHAIETARTHGYRIIEVGTGNAGIGQLALYQKCGFQIYGVDVDFFKWYCPHPIVENGIPCLHMIRMKMEL
ncbi:MAG: GNAT family N-acetyltransferase [Tannerellaceae bacterium]|nr:GNAT family N-acetyltransferase [Tannerellaceae bacterium]